MPRQIIDTESSRPRYVRRIVITTVVLVLVAAAVLVAAFAEFGHLMHAPVPGK
jgi:hypothetical protein